MMIWWYSLHCMCVPGIAFTVCTWYVALVLLCSRGEKSAMCAAIFSIIIRLISLFQIASGVSNSPRNVSLNLSAPGGGRRGRQYVTT